VTLANGNNAFCIKDAFDAAGNTLVGLSGPDGQADGFVDPQAPSTGLWSSKSTSRCREAGRCARNYRIAKLLGNYEGSFRNDNGQNDPNISSLFDFTRGDFNLLGQQFVPGC